MQPQLLHLKATGSYNTDQIPQQLIASATARARAVTVRGGASRASTSRELLLVAEELELLMAVAICGSNSCTRRAAITVAAGSRQQAAAKVW